MPIYPSSESAVKWLEREAQPFWMLYEEHGYGSRDLVAQYRPQVDKVLTMEEALGQFQYTIQGLKAGKVRTFKVFAKANQSTGNDKAVSFTFETEPETGASMQGLGSLQAPGSVLSDERRELAREQRQLERDLGDLRLEKALHQRDREAFTDEKQRFEKEKDEAKKELQALAEKYENGSEMAKEGIGRFLGMAAKTLFSKKPEDAMALAGLLGMPAGLPAATTAAKDEDDEEPLTPAQEEIKALADYIHDNVKELPVLKMLRQLIESHTIPSLYAKLAQKGNGAESSESHVRTDSGDAGEGQDADNGR